MSAKPLVSIVIPNYNYGRYLATCLESAVTQTYENLEVVFADNDSTDESYDIALEFQARYRDRLRVHRNYENIGASQNYMKANSMMDPRTQCYIYLASDDYFDRTFVARSMAIIEEYPSVGFVLVHRHAVDGAGSVTPELPFYNCSCVIPGTGQMEVFMMAGVGVSSQCFRNCQVERSGDSTISERFDIAGDWFSNFRLASFADMGYIQDPLCYYRTHPGNVTTTAVRDLTNSVEHILLVHAFDDHARRLDRPTVSRRLGPALEKLGTMCLRYCTQLLHEGDARTAKRYLHLGTVLRRDIVDDPAWKTLWRIAGLGADERGQALAEFEAASPQRRLVSYDPPAGSIRI